MKFLSYLLLFTCATIAMSCDRYPWDECDVGEGDNFEHPRNFENFHTFILDIPASIKLIPDTNLKSSQIVIYGQKNVVKEVVTSISEGVVRVSFDGCFKSHNDLEFRIYTPWLKKLTLNAASRVETDFALFGDHFTLEANTGTNIDMGCVLDSLYTSFRSGGNIMLNGYASRQILVCTSTGSYVAPDMVSDSAIIDMSGSGYANIYSSGYFIGLVSGSGKIDFSGEDTLNVIQNITGSGSINDLR